MQVKFPSLISTSASVESLDIQLMSFINMSIALSLMRAETSIRSEGLH